MANQDSENIALGQRMPQSFAGLIAPQDILATFLEMVQTNSPSGAEGPMRDYCIHRFESLKALCPTLIHITDETGNLIIDIPSEGCSHDNILIFSGHLDVVPPCLDVRPVVTELDEILSAGNTSFSDCLITSDGTTVLGADDKAGLAALIEALRSSFTHKTPRPAIRFIFTVGEETGLFGAKALEDKYLQASFAITFDHTGCQGTLIHKAPAHYDYKVTFGGKSVHAGIMPEQGVNAIVFASRVLRKLPQGKMQNGLTANFGKIWGGKGTNVVPDAIELTGEIRGHDTAAIEAGLMNIQTTLQAEQTLMSGTSFAYEEEVAYLPYELPLEHPGVVRVIAAMRELGIEPNPITTNGGSDNNIFMARGLPGIVLSAAYKEPHSLKESVKLSDIVTCANLTLHLMAAFAQEPFAAN